MIDALFSLIHGRGDRIDMSVSSSIVEGDGVLCRVKMKDEG